MRYPAPLRIASGEIPGGRVWRRSGFGGYCRKQVFDGDHNQQPPPAWAAFDELER